MQKSLEDIIHHYRQDSGNVITLLQETQESLGYIPREAIDYFAETLNIAPSRFYGVATFYAQFRFTPMGRHVMKVCHGTACHVQGAETLDVMVESKLGIKPGGTTADGEFTVERVACLGCCSLAPVVMIDGEVYGRLTGDKLGKIISSVVAAGQKQ